MALTLTIDALTNLVKDRLKMRNMENMIQLFEKHKINDNNIERDQWDHEKLTRMGIDAESDRCAVLEIITGINEPRKIKSKIFQDPLHGAIELHPLLVKIIDTPQFQRLRDIKQLGGVYYVFPGASHNRFEHSIGVCYLAGEFIEHLREKQPELGISEQDVLCVKIAGLCHDMGHGPYSHLFQDLFIPELKKDSGSQCKHEAISIKLLKHLVEKNALHDELSKYGLDWDRDSAFINDLITGKEQGFEKEPFLYEIVANSISGIDVDKMDYILRDCHGLGIKMAFDWKRYMLCCRVIKAAGEDNQTQYHICPREKEVASLYELFRIRDHLFRVAYQHKTKRAVEFMLNDALVKADPFLRIPGKDCKEVIMSEAMDDMDAFTLLTDSVFYQIRMSISPDLEEKLLARVDNRDFYTYIDSILPTKSKPNTPMESVGSTKLASHAVHRSTSRPDTYGIETHLVEFACQTNDKLKAKEVKEAIKLDHVVFNLGDKEGLDKPIEKIHFYRKRSPHNAVPVKHTQTPGIFPLPEVSREFQYRLYSKSKDQRIVEALRSAVVLMCQRESDAFEMPLGEDSSLVEQKT